MAGVTSYLEFEDRDQWRRWLEKNHATEAEAWLIFLKVKYVGDGLTLDQAVEEALCFGWIDGVLNSLDERRYALRFTPRTPKSTWSMSNIRRVEVLVAAGKMTAAGQRCIDQAKENGEWEAAIRREQVDIIPAELEVALSERPGALSAYRALPNSRKKQYLYWLQQAKREETRQSRIRKIVGEVLDR